jgi:hypothetical protein
MRSVNPEVMASTAGGEENIKPPNFPRWHHDHLRLFVGNDHLGRGQAIEHRNLAKVLAFFNKVKTYFAAIQREVYGLQPAF